MPDYNQSKIYRIVCNITGHQYIGSTTVPLTRRLSKHVSQNKGKYSCRSKQIIDGGDYDIILIEEFPCENREQLHARERFFIESMDCVNKSIPTRKFKEYYETYKDKLLTQHKQYRIDNKESLAEKRKQYTLDNAERFREYNKQYYATHKEYFQQYQKEYQKTHREALRENLRRHRAGRKIEPETLEN